MENSNLHWRQKLIFEDSPMQVEQIEIYWQNKINQFHSYPMLQIDWIEEQELPLNRKSI